ncbi:uncharacterized protein METZ01_LOCUS57151 [marine metagenome]|uniref:Uncharacterized protein n=1 Tax=marine metagenome TaxID=408172 RepID=A0A381SPJ0_9ZZZZ
MSFVASIFTAIVDVIVSIVETVIQIVEVIIQAIMVLLGFDGGSTQIIEYFEVHNIPLFEDVDKKNPLLNSLIRSILNGQDLISNLIYHSVFRSLKGNVQDFMNFIDNGNYFENFPTVESYILTIDYTELTAALNTLNGVPCTPEGSYLRALSKVDWAKYWLQENAGYNVGTNTIGEDHSTTSTSPITPAADTVTVTPSTNHFDIAITSEIASSDEVFADERWQADLTNIVYNSGPDTYTIPVYNAATVGSITRNYTAPTKPTQLHYVSFYYRDSAPSRQYLFIYQAGSGTYTDLDTIEEPIDIDGATIEALPCVPLRLSNSNYTTFGTTKKDQIEDLLDIIHLDAETVLDTILEESGIPGGDLDHIYVNFGVRMWDTSQAGMSYLYTMFENLYPAQGVTQGTYNDSPTGDDKPQNNIIITTDDNKLAYQWSYITFEHTSLAAIDADSGSVENGIYYSDMSKFDADGILVYNYFVSSGKGTYNVGYKADDLDEVQDFLDGSGVPNPGDTSGEATNWLQVTTRLSYNNPSPVLQESDGATADLKHLTPDLVYENNGSGVLRMVESASEETTVGQSITYYCVKPSGLDAYTVVAPISSCRVVDGSSGHFRVVKFNLGNKMDLMVPFIHTFIKNLSNDKVSKLFLAGAHASIYVAHYEVIVHEGMSFLQALVIIVIVVVIIVFAPEISAYLGEALGNTLAGQLVTAIGAGASLGTIAGIILSALPGLLFDFVVQMAIQMIITEIAGDNEGLAMLLNLVAMVGMAAWEGNVTYGPSSGTVSKGPVTTNSLGQSMGGGAARGWTNVSHAAPSSLQFNNMTSFNFSNVLSPMNLAKYALAALEGIGSMSSMSVNTLTEEMSAERAAWNRERLGLQSELDAIKDSTDVYSGNDPLRAPLGTVNKIKNTRLSGEYFIKATVTEWHAINTLVPFMSPFDTDYYASIYA